MPKHTSPAQPLEGSVIAFNVSPKGSLEGALLSTRTGLAQLNFPKHDDGALARSMKVGAKLAIDAELEHDDGPHPVYRASDAEGAVTGTIVRLNHALHGEPNGCILDDGTFIHLKPEGAKRHKLKVGETIKAHGTRRRGADAVVVDARSVERIRKSA